MNGSYVAAEIVEDVDGIEPLGKTTSLLSIVLRGRVASRPIRRGGGSTDNDFVFCSFSTPLRVLEVIRGFLVLWILRGGGCASVSRSAADL